RRLKNLGMAIFLAPSKLLEIFGRTSLSTKKWFASAFWLSLGLAAAAALTVFLWPAALAAVVGFAIANVSIATITSSVPLQVLLFSGLVFAASSIAST